MACQNENITLSCPENTTISLSDGIYGYHTFECFTECCPQSLSSDWSGSINATYEEDWVYLMYLCEDKESCKLQYKGRNSVSCGPIAGKICLFLSCINNKHTFKFKFINYLYCPYTLVNFWSFFFPL